MHIFKHKIFLCIGMTCLLFALSNESKAQNISFRYNYKLDLSNATEAPQFSAFPEFTYPDAARKNGVEGTLKLTLTLGEDGKVKDIVVGQDLPFGVSQAVTKDLQQLKFQPAKRDGKPIAVKMLFDYVVSAVYDERDKNVSKPKIISQPDAVYPENLRSEKRKDKVFVRAIFFKDGTLKIENVSSTMPKEFDRAAAEAAEKIKFEPAIHKKSKQPVSQDMTIEYNFKP